MNVSEVISERQVPAKSGQKVVRKYRCVTGSSKGRTVVYPQCFVFHRRKKETYNNETYKSKTWSKNGTEGT